MHSGGCLAPVRDKSRPQRQLSTTLASSLASFVRLFVGIVRSFTSLLILLLIYSFVYSIIRSLFRSFIRPLVLSSIFFFRLSINPFIYSIIPSYTHSFIRVVDRSFLRSFACSLFYWLTGSFSHLFFFFSVIRLFIHLFMRSFTICSFVFFLPHVLSYSFFILQYFLGLLLSLLSQAMSTLYRRAL